MLKIEGRTFMNIQEAVQWLLDNNALPFQCTANYQANTEIGLGTIVNPTPAKVRIGSLIFFADSKVSTVVGITDTGFICSDKYNNLVDDVVYVSNVAINAGGHLIVTLSDGTNIDAGLIKQVSNFSINASQHLIANYNDGTTTDLGAIFNGNVNIAGNFTADSIIENMVDYVFLPTAEQAGLTREFIYAGIVKNGNKLTLVVALNLTRTGTAGSNQVNLGVFGIPSAVGSRIYSTNIGGETWASSQKIDLVKDINGTNPEGVVKISAGATALSVYLRVADINNTLTLNDKHYVRAEVTFLLSNNLAS